MEFESHCHVIHAWKQAMGLGNSLDTGHIGREFGIYKVEAVGEE